MKKSPKDPRDKLWTELEAEIQRRGAKKDRSFKLSGPWKKFIRKQQGFNIYAVDATWIRNNLCVYFGHGGHELVHEFIPRGEIWVSTRHSHERSAAIGFISNCGCRVKKKNQPVSKNYFDSTVIHEITEFFKMKKGLPYWAAHNIALDKELEIGLLIDPFTDL